MKLISANRSAIIITDELKNVCGIFGEPCMLIIEAMHTNKKEGDRLLCSQTLNVTLNIKAMKTAVAASVPRTG